ncbi:MAG TPA: flagellin [Xanthobacteraceae bacterium]|nr:flagellin [Xanthobacteraceae bacterium]
MASSITLSAGVRANLLSLQHTAGLMSTTQTRLATGKKVNTALDNPVNFFTASSLQSRSSDLSALLDSMSNGIKTLEAADNGLTSITSTLQSMKSTLQQARQDKSFQTTSYTLDSTTIGTASLKNLSFSGGAVGTTPVNVALNVADVAATPGSATSGTVPGTYSAGTLSINGTNVSISANTNAAGLKSAIDTAAIAGITTSVSGSTITISNANGNVDFTGSTGQLLTDLGLSTSTNYVAGVPGSVKTVDALVAAINSNSSLTGKVTASNDGGKLRIQNLSTADLTVTGASSSAIDGSNSTATIKGNDVRKSLVTQYNDLKDQLDKFADDASFNGINLLRGDNLKITFNETATSTISIQAKTTAGAPTAIDSAYLGITTLANASVDSDANIDTLTANLTTALNSVRSQSSTFGSSLSIVQNRQDFTKAMINTLQTGADNLTLADTNEEAANMLALQTRQQLSQTALSLASQADQAVLRLF